MKGFLVVELRSLRFMLTSLGQLIQTCSICSVQINQFMGTSSLIYHFPKPCALGSRIAREVHDELGQMLTVLKLETSMCELAYAQLDPGLLADTGISEVERQVELSKPFWR